MKSRGQELSNGIWHAYIEQHRGVIYRWKSLDLYFSTQLMQFAYLQCNSSRRACPWCFAEQFNPSQSDINPFTKQWPFPKIYYFDFPDVWVSVEWVWTVVSRRTGFLCQVLPFDVIRPIRGSETSKYGGGYIKKKIKHKEFASVFFHSRKVTMFIIFISVWSSPSHAYFNSYHSIKLQVYPAPQVFKLYNLLACWSQKMPCMIWSMFSIGLYSTCVFVMPQYKSQ